MLLIILGNGLLQPASYAAVRQITTEKTATMGYAMLYALMNLGGWMPVFFAPVRRSVGISGTYVVYTLISISVLLLTALVLSRKTMKRAVPAAAAQREKEQAAKDEQAGADGATDAAKRDEPAEEAVQAASPKSGGFFAAARDWIVHHPLADLRFSFFIFALIPAQTLFAHNWLTIPMYVERAYRGSWIRANFEAAVSSNMLLVFILVPLVTAATRKAKVYNMMIAGTFVMGAPAFLLALGPSVWNLAAYILLMTIGEAMWQPRFLQYAAEIAPEGRTGAYIGVAMFPWFMTKLITGLYSGWFLARYCPIEGELNTEPMWLIYGLIAISSTVMLVIARRWAGQGIDARG